MLLRRLNSRFTHGAIKGRKQLLLNTNIASSVSGANNVGRPYFTFMDRVKEAFRVPVRHLESFVEPQGRDYESQIPTTEHLYGNTAMVFNAYLTHNAIDMNTWHDMDNTYHNQFGTVDNPVLVFTTDSSWRMVICMGPGVEDESHSHEKMFYFLREGPMNRCHICGQCFKLVRLKDEYSEVNDYYSFMFSSLTHFDISEEDASIPLHTLFGDRPAPNMQSASHSNVYVHVNPDEADHMLVDPAYKLERLEQAYERFEALQAAFNRADEESKTFAALPITTSRQDYSNWHAVEKAIFKLDRLFLKVEKFHARQFIDPENHERRDKRMLDRKRDRWADNYTYFFGGLSEEEQMYRDYFQTDLENDSEDERREELMDEIELADTGEFDLRKFEFIEANIEADSHQSLHDLVDRKLFKYKYRVNSDDRITYMKRMDRVIQRQLERAKNRDPSIEVNLAEAMEKHDREDAFGVTLYRLSKQLPVSDQLNTATEGIRKYMVDESLQQYKDYFESDEEEQEFFEYLEELPNRDRIKFIEIFEDYTIPRKDGKGFVKIPKREYNPELSFFSNVALDLIDFKDRVQPLAKDAARLDATYKHQRMTADETYEVIKEGREALNQYLEAQGERPIDFGSDKDLLSSEEFLSSEESPHAHSPAHDHMSKGTEGGHMLNTEEEINSGNVSADQEEEYEAKETPTGAFKHEDEEREHENDTSSQEEHDESEKFDGSKKN